MRLPRTSAPALPFLLVTILSSAALAAADPCLMPAAPELIERVGREEVARLQDKAYTPELRQELAHDRTAKSLAGPAVTGTGTCLVILWEFSDHPADQVNHPTSNYDDMMFSTGTFPTGSMNDYYLEVSQGQFGVQGTVVPWTTATNTYASYAIGGEQNATTAKAMLADAIAQLDPVIDFSQFDQTGPSGVPDGIVDSVFFVHAGPGQEQSGNTYDIWSHAWSFFPDLATDDGVVIDRYSVEPEEFTDGTQISIGVFTHEYGHVLGLPDLYDTDYSSQGIGEWGLMSGGSWTHRPGDPLASSPTHMTAWSKIQMGWLTPVTLTADQAGVVADPAETNPTAYLIPPFGTPGGEEYFLVENRRRIGFDEGLVRRQINLGLADPEGLIIYHVNEALTGNSNDTRRLVDVVDASPWFNPDTTWYENLDGPPDFYSKVYGHNRGDRGDLWPGFSTFDADTADWTGTRDRTTFSDSSVPPATSHYCTATGVEISNIALVGTDVVFDVSFADPTTAIGPVATTTSWDFETGADDWQFCESYVHWDQTQAGACGGAGGLWFGTDGWANCGGVGYGNSWNDLTWVTMGLVIADAPAITIRHNYELESGYDFAYVEVRAAGDPGAAWTVLGQFDGASGCRQDVWPVPAGVLTAGDPDGNGVAGVELRLRMTSDGAWSAEDGSYCGIGWWVDDVSVTGAYPADAPLPGAAPAAAALAPAAPNPFNPATTLRYRVPAGARQVALAVFDAAGRRVRTMPVETAAGWHEVRWDGRGDRGARVASGLYFARLEVDGAAQIQKMALVK